MLHYASAQRCNTELDATHTILLDEFIPYVIQWKQTKPIFLINLM